MSLGLFAAIGAARIASTYRVFNHTVDEPAHLACGMEWLDRGRYAYQALHPPLPRVAAALLPRLSGARSHGEQGMIAEGRRILYESGGYFRTLSLARAGQLPFFLLATLLVGLLARRFFGEVAGVTAAFLFTTAPPVLGHAGLATTDIAVTATFLAAFGALLVWLEKRTVARSLLLGVAVALAVMSKFSAIAFLVGFGAILAGLSRAARSRRRAETERATGMRVLPALGIALAALLLTIWAAYRFTFSPIGTPDLRLRPRIDRVIGQRGRLNELAYRITETPLPAGQFLRGLLQLTERNERATPPYFLGVNRQSRPLAFFPIVLAVKTPIPILVLAAGGAALVARRWWTGTDPRGLAVLAAAAAVLAVAILSRINIGTRHVLPIFPFLALLAGAAASRLLGDALTRPVAFAGAVAILTWHVAASVRAHPDYLADFNEIAGRHPERIVVDSDLDWGQDLERLSKKLRELRLEAVSIAYFGTADLNRHGLPPHGPLRRHQRSSGWIAISLQRLKRDRERPPHDGFRWLEAYEPVTRVGKSILLYYVPANALSAPRPGP
ncbi:MAG: ArnT family glycosyltransferase [Thermoanaerobaculia bacterium]